MTKFSNLTSVSYFKCLHFRKAFEMSSISEIQTMNHINDDEVWKHYDIIVHSPTDTVLLSIYYDKQISANFVENTSILSISFSALVFSFFV